MAVSTRTRFEIFKRDEFTCRYCGRKSPEVVLEIDHILAVANGGTDDRVNLATSCWGCNRGKGAVPLEEVIHGEDPHERAILILEQERQLAEYNQVLRVQRERIQDDYLDVCQYWSETTGRSYISAGDQGFIRWAVTVCPVEKLKEFIDYAAARRKTSGLAYINACLKRWREDPD